MSDRLPRSYEKFGKEHGELLARYEALNAQTRLEGPLGDDEVALLKIAISVGAGLEGAMASQTRKALKLGLDPKKIEQVALLSLPTLGLPRMMQAWKTIKTTIEEQGSQTP